MTLSVVGGTLTVVGGSLAGLGGPPAPPVFTPTDTLDSFDSTIEGWAVAPGTAAVGSYPGMTGTGALSGTQMPSGSANFMGFSSPAASGAGTYNFPVGSSLEFEVYVPSANTGTWTLQPDLIGSDFSHNKGPITTLTSDAVNRVVWAIPSGLTGTNHKQLVVNFTASGITATTTASVVYIGGIRVGTVA